MSSKSIENLAYELGPEGRGIGVMWQFMDRDYTDAINQELADPELPWYKQTGFMNKAGKWIDQNFEVFALKLTRGDQETYAHMQAYHSLAGFVTENVVEPLAEHFPSRETWGADELSSQRYPDKVGELSWHFDLERHTGIIAICSVDGQAVLSAQTRLGVFNFELHPGDIAVLRAPGLFDAGLVDGPFRPRHAVTEILGDQPRTSITIRDNNLPDTKPDRFEYANWHPEQPAQ